MALADVGYGQQEVSRAPRVTWLALHFLTLCGAGLILALGHGDPARRALLLTFGSILWVRMALTGLVLLERRLPWSEALSVVLATALYQLGFAALGAESTAPLGPADAVAAGLYLLGAGLNTGSELARRRFKARPENHGRLYTRGPFALVRHPNYLGDVLWGIGWALATTSSFAWGIVVIEVAGFVLASVPALDRHLEQHYGSQFQLWAEKTKRLFPFIW